MPRSEKEVKQDEALETILKGGTPDKPLQVSKSDAGATQRVPDLDEGETWEDGKGNLWEKDGSSVIKYSSGKKKDAVAGLPLFCPECGRVMNRQMDEKMYYRTSMCGDCVIERESKMKAEGTYELYEKKKVLKNMKSWYCDLQQGAEDFFKDINNQNYLTQQGPEEYDIGVEEWQDLSDDEIQNMKDNVNEEFQKIEDKIEEIQDEIEELKEETDKEVDLEDIEI